MTQVGIRGPGQKMWLSFYVLGWTHDPADSTVYYIGGRQVAPGTVVNMRKVITGIAGRIFGAEISTYAGTGAGSAENISLYIRLNNITDYLISTVGLAAAERNFQNFSLNIPIIATDFFEIKISCPAWVTNPTGVNYWGYVYFEV